MTKSSKNKKFILSKKKHKLLNIITKSKKKLKFLKQRGGGPIKKQIIGSTYLSDLEDKELKEIIEDGKPVKDNHKEIDCKTNLITSYCDSLHDFAKFIEYSVFKDAFQDYLHPEGMEPLHKSKKNGLLEDKFRVPLLSGAANVVIRGEIIKFRTGEIPDKIDKLNEHNLEKPGAFIYDAGTGISIIEGSNTKGTTPFFVNSNIIHLDNLSTIIDPSGSTHIETMIDYFKFKTEFLNVYDKYFYFLKNIDKKGVSTTSDVNTKSVYIYFKYRHKPNNKFITKESCKKSGNVKVCTKAWCILYMTGSYNTSTQTTESDIMTIIAKKELEEYLENKEQKDGNFYPIDSNDRAADALFRAVAVNSQDKMYAIKINTENKPSFTISRLKTAITDNTNDDNWCKSPPAATTATTATTTDLKYMSNQIYSFFFDGSNDDDTTKSNLKNKINKYLFTNKIIGDRGQGDIAYIINDYKKKDTDNKNWVYNKSNLDNDTAIGNLHDNKLRGIKPIFIVTGDRMLFLYLVTIGVPALWSSPKNEHYFYFTEGKLRPKIDVKFINTTESPDKKKVQKYIDNLNVIKANWSDLKKRERLEDNTQILFSITNPSISSYLNNNNNPKILIEDIPIKYFNDFIQNIIFETIYEGIFYSVKDTIVECNNSISFDLLKNRIKLVNEIVSSGAQYKADHWSDGKEKQKDHEHMAQFDKEIAPPDDKIKRENNSEQFMFWDIFITFYSLWNGNDFRAWDPEKPQMWGKNVTPIESFFLKCGIVIKKVPIIHTQYTEGPNTTPDWYWVQKPNATDFPFNKLLNYMPKTANTIAIDKTMCGNRGFVQSFSDRYDGQINYDIIKSDKYCEIIKIFKDERSKFIRKRSNFNQKDKTNPIGKCNIYNFWIWHTLDDTHSQDGMTIKKIVNKVIDTIFTFNDSVEFRKKLVGAAKKVTIKGICAPAKVQYTRQKDYLYGFKKNAKNEPVEKWDTAQGGTDGSLHKTINDGLNTMNTNLKENKIIVGKIKDKLQEIINYYNKYHFLESYKNLKEAGELKLETTENITAALPPPATATTATAAAAAAAAATAAAALAAAAPGAVPSTAPPPPLFSESEWVDDGRGNKTWQDFTNTDTNVIACNTKKYINASKLTESYIQESFIISLRDGKA